MAAANDVPLHHAYPLPSAGASLWVGAISESLVVNGMMLMTFVPRYHSVTHGPELL
jgi:hypothetical protein